MRPPPLDPEYRLVRLAYGLFYLLALPLFLFVGFVLVITWLTSPHWGDGVMEGPEPSNVEVLRLCAAGAAFSIGYVAVWLLAPRITHARTAWIPFAAHIPALVSLLWIGSCWSTSSAAERLYPLTYLAILLVVLAGGIYATFRVDLR